MAAQTAPMWGICEAVSNTLLKREKKVEILFIWTRSLP